MSAWCALVLADAVAVASLARCFTGPGELALALLSLLGVHLAALAARGGRPAVSSPAADAPRGRPVLRRAWWLAAIVIAALLPVVWVLGSTLTWGLPLHATWHGVDRVLAGAWPVYEHRLAPVPEVAGLVLATGWAAGVVGLVSEALSARRLPPALALCPAIGVFVFAAALGTPAWRVPSMAAEAAAAVWYLATTARAREAELHVVVATTDTPSPSGSEAGWSGRRWSTARLALLAGAAAAIVGPNLPGASSAALVSWHGNGPGGARAGSASGPSGPAAAGVQVSTLVQVAQEEINNTSTVLFVVHSQVVTREVIATLDNFDGSKWTSSNGSLNGSAARSIAVPWFATSVADDERRPPAPIQQLGATSRIVTQAIRVYGLGGFGVPAPGDPSAVVGIGRVSRDGPGGSLISGVPLQQGSTYAVESSVPDPTQAELDHFPLDLVQPGIELNLSLPLPIPPAIDALAHSIVAGATTPFQEALDLQAYLTSDRFHYRLPGRTANGGVAVASEGYAGLVNFLTVTRTGYCQQFATAFAVMARVDGLPTRIAVGFLPGARAGGNAWVVTGAETHAWPQVDFGKLGWIDFEPTPGALTTGTQGVPPPVKLRPSVASKHYVPAHNFRPAPQGGGAATTPKIARHRHGSAISGPSVFLVLLLAAVAWAVVVPAWRVARRRRRGADPRRGVLGAWRDAAATLDLAGIHRRRAETYLELASRVATAGVLTAEGEDALRELAVLATRACYAAEPPPGTGPREAAGVARRVRQGARRSVAWWRRALALVDPRELALR